MAGASFALYQRGSNKFPLQLHQLRKINHLIEFNVFSSQTRKLYINNNAQQMIQVFFFCYRLKFFKIRILLKQQIITCCHSHCKWIDKLVRVLEQINASVYIIIITIKKSRAYYKSRKVVDRWHSAAEPEARADAATDAFSVSLFWFLSPQGERAAGTTREQATSQKCTSRVQSTTVKSPRRQL